MNKAVWVHGELCMGWLFLFCQWVFWLKGVDEMGKYTDQTELPEKYTGAWSKI